MECFWATTLAASGNTTIVVIGNHSGVKGGGVERAGPEVEVGGHKLDHSSILFGFRLPKPLRAGRLVQVCGPAWDGEFNFRPGCCEAPDFESRADSSRPLA